MAARALILDLDGTVWDSAPWFAAALADGPDAVAALANGLRTTGNIVRVTERAGFTRQRLLREAGQRCGPPPLFPGMRAALDGAAARGVWLAVATSLPGSIALPMIEMAGLTGLLGPVIHAGVCRAFKPSPASINMALRGLGIADPQTAVYIGDRAVDAEAARRAGMPMAWVTHGYEPPVSTSHVVVTDAGGIAAL